MTVEITRGQTEHQVLAGQLADYLAQTIQDGSVYIGFPILSTADESLVVDVLLVNERHGAVAFIMGEAESEDLDSSIRAQDDLFGALMSHFLRYPGLVRQRKLIFEPAIFTVYGARPLNLPQELQEHFIGLEDVNEKLTALPSVELEVRRLIDSSIQRMSTIGPRKRRDNASRAGSKGSVLKQMEAKIANLDHFQKSAAIESPNGPQRIRGLAGSGKTVVLALKAALWHSQNPDWKIAVTFYSQGLYDMFDDLTNRFSYEFVNRPRNPEQLQVLHAWGSRRRPGIYSLIADALDVVPRDFGYANRQYGRDGAFQGVLQELLQVAESRVVRAEPLFDAVLIDEAQDLPAEFFRLVRLFTKPPSKIVYAYDELQRLSDSTMPDTPDLFGFGAWGAEEFSLTQTPGEPKRDVVLRVCYRNTPWALTVAHGFGIGVNRPGGLVQSPADPILWSDIGYQTEIGTLAPGENVVLSRATSSYPEYFTDLIGKEDAVQVKRFDTIEIQDQWIAEQIRINLTLDQLDPDDILIVLPDTFRAKGRAPGLINQLAQLGIDAHLAGVNTQADVVFKSGSVAIAHIFRAKGNETPMVYVVDANFASSDFNAVYRRNILFTGITRSKAWVRITGFGDGMRLVEDEVNQIIASDFRLSFKIPTEPELAVLRHTHRDRGELAERELLRATSELSAILEKMEKSGLSMADLPIEIRDRLLLDADSGDDTGDN